MLKKRSSVLAVLLALCFSSCFTLDHTVGMGAQGSQEEEKRVWYALWGLVPLTDFDSKELAGDAKDYDVRSQQTFLDIVINIFTGFVTINSQTVTVTK
jgi:hypothetical protein